MGSPRKLFNELVVVAASDASIAVTATEGIGAFDRLDAAGEDNALHDLVAIVTFDSAEATATAGVSLKLQHADDDGAGNPATWSDATASTASQVGGPTVASISGQVSGNVITADAAAEFGTDDLYVLGYLGDKRHVRVAVTNLDTTDAFTAGITVYYLGANPRDMIR